MQNESDFLRLKKKWQNWHGRVCRIYLSSWSSKNVHHFFKRQPWKPKGSVNHSYQTQINSEKEWILFQFLYMVIIQFVIITIICIQNQLPTRQPPRRQTFALSSGIRTFVRFSLITLNIIRPFVYHTEITTCMYISNLQHHYHIHVPSCACRLWLHKAHSIARICPSSQKRALAFISRLKAFIVVKNWSNNFQWRILFLTPIQFQVYKNKLRLGPKDSFVTDTHNNKIYIQLTHMFTMAEENQNIFNLRNHNIKKFQTLWCSSCSIHSFKSQITFSFIMHFYLYW